MRTLPLICLLLASALSACGYSVKREPAVKEVSIGYLDNRTHEPGLSDSLRTALTLELAARGVRASDGADTKITGTIAGLSVSPLAERRGTLVKFSVSMDGDFMLTGPGEEQRKLGTPLHYIVAFGSDAELGELYSMRDEAVRRAVADLASDIAAAVAEDR